MAVSRKAMTEGIRTTTFPGTLADAASQSLSLVLAGDARASSLYTREPGCSRTSALFRTIPAQKNRVPKNRDAAEICAIQAISP